MSINLNKIALIRNSREGNNPDLIEYAKKCTDAGATGLTVHPRPDQRHIRPEDCLQLKKLTSEHNKQYLDDTQKLEFNIEGNPFAKKTAANRKDFSDYPGFLNILEQCSPHQATLVPDSNTQLTSDHGFDLRENTHSLQTTIQEIKQIGCRVSLFMDPDLEQISRACDIGADRIELYTGPFADAYANGLHEEASKIFEQHCIAAEYAYQKGLRINAGHDLNLKNLLTYCKLSHLEEVSIGHALTIDALEYGLSQAINQYLTILR